MLSSQSPHPVRSARPVHTPLSGRGPYCLSRQPYLLGERITESDWHLFCTLVRFDAAYHGALRCNLYRLVDFPALTAFTRRVYRLPGVAETVRFDHIKAHYYDTLGELNPRIVPAGPARDFRE